MKTSADIDYSGTMPKTSSAQIELFTRDQKHNLHLISQEKLPTNTTTNRHPVHRWFNFIAGFSPEFVHLCCDALQAPRMLLDPFGGCGTAPLVAKERGIDSVSYDPHPIFARIARGKLANSNLEYVDEIESLLMSALNSHQFTQRPLSNDADKFLSKLFAPSVLNSLLNARAALLSSKFVQSDLAFLMLSKVVEMSTHSLTDGVYKAPTTKKRADSPQTSCNKMADIIRNDLYAFDTGRTCSAHKVIEQSSTAMPQVLDNSVDLVVTSPPYLNNFDFAEMTRMLLYFWGIADSWSDITSKVRSRLIVNTTTALKGHKEKQSEYCASLSPALQRKLAPLVEQLATLRTQRAGKKEYDFLIYPYFSQMTKVLQECHRCLKSGGPVHIMVADAALYGVHISTPQLIAEILEHLGFQGTRCDFVRKRGHRWVLSKREGSEKGLGEYHVFATK